MVAVAVLQVRRAHPEEEARLAAAAAAAAAATLAELPRIGIVSRSPPGVPSVVLLHATHCPCRGSHLVSRR